VAAAAEVSFSIMSASGRLRLATTGRRIVFSFSAVLGLFAIALAVMLVGLDRIAGAETEVVRLDHAKHAGHQAAALAREQYIHQAHTMLEWNRSHVGHYSEVAVQARAAADALRGMVDGTEARGQADEIARLVAESDHYFRSEVLAAIAKDDRARVSELHRRTEEVVDKVVRINERLNAALEARSEEAQRRAEGIRSQARFLVLCCFGLAILLAAAVGGYLMRSISRPMAALRQGVQRAGSGNLRDEIQLGGDDEFAELARAFNLMTRDLSRHHAQLLEAHRLASLGQVASGVAHEVNNPLGVILGYTVLLRSDPALREREELAIIEDEVRQCQRIVAGLLDLARPVRLDVSELDLGEVIREAVARLDESGRTGEVSISLEEPVRPVLVRADEARVRQILVNLLMNAVEAAASDGAADKLVLVRWRSEGARIEIEVLDHGPGIAADTLPRLFEPFFSTKARGHGLGLAIARSLARAHGGDITVAPRGEGPGTRATLVLPVRPEEERDA